MGMETAQLPPPPPQHSEHITQLPLPYITPLRHSPDIVSPVGKSRETSGKHLEEGEQLGGVRILRL